MWCVSFEQLPLSREQLRSEVDLLNDVLPNIGSPVVFCHNDLLLRNVIYNEQQSEEHLQPSQYHTFSRSLSPYCSLFCLHWLLFL